MVKSTNPVIVIETALGEISLELFINQAPLTSQNFLTYVQNGDFDSSSFYRVVRPDTLSSNPVPNAIPIEVIQGGLGMAPHANKRDPIMLERTSETGLSHKEGALSMGRLEPNSASSEFFICVSDQPELDFGGKRNPDGQGFAAFGQVISGMDVVKAIWQCPAVGQKLEPEIAIHKIYVAK